MEFEQLILCDDGSISVEEKRFIAIHKDIVYCGSAAAEFAVKMASKLKEMRDSKAYKAAGFNSFGEYTDSALGLKERQAYTYIKAYENLPESFLQLNAKLGVTKLALLASLSESDRDEVIVDVAVEDITVKELQSIIAEKSKKVEQLSMMLEDKDSIEDELIELQAIVESKELEVEKLRTELEHAEKNKIVETVMVNDDMAKDEIANLKIINGQRNSDIKALNDKLNAMSALKIADAEKREEIKSLTERLKAIDNAPPKTVTDPAVVAELESVKAAVADKDIEIANLSKKVELAADTVLNKFKVKFEDLQRLYGECIALVGQLTEDKQAKANNAMKTIIGGWKI